MFRNCIPLHTPLHRRIGFMMHCVVTSGKSDICDIFTDRKPYSTFKPWIMKEGRYILHVLLTQTHLSVKMRLSSWMMWARGFPLLGACNGGRLRHTDIHSLCYSPLFLSIIVLTCNYLHFSQSNSPGKCREQVHGENCKWSMASNLMGRIIGISYHHIYVYCLWKALSVS